MELLSVSPHILINTTADILRQKKYGDHLSQGNEDEQNEETGYDDSEMQRLFMKKPL
jgi:hypothetical protein